MKSSPAHFPVPHLPVRFWMPWGQTLFAVRPQLRTDSAVEMFRKDEISLLRAAEMAGLDFESFRILLMQRAIPWEVEAEPTVQLDRAIEDFFRGHA